MCWSPESPSSLRQPVPGPFPTAREGTTATLLGTGNVLLTGFRQGCKGCGLKPSNAAVLYEFFINTYAFTGGMNSARVFDSAVHLPNGQVLVSGGTSTISSGATLASAELYMPESICSRCARRKRESRVPRLTGLRHKLHPLPQVAAL